MARRPRARIGETIEQAEQRAKHQRSVNQRSQVGKGGIGEGKDKRGGALEDVKQPDKSCARPKPARIRRDLKSQERREVLWARFIEEIRKARFIGTACSLAGFSTDALYAWLDKGRLGIEPYDRFLREFKAADAEAQTHVLDELLAESDPSEGSKNRKWFAERRWRKDCGEVVRVEVLATDHLPRILSAIAGVCDEQTFSRILEAIEGVVPALPPESGASSPLRLGAGSTGGTVAIEAAGESVD